MADRLDVALAEAHDRYVASRPRSRELAERASRVMPGGNTRSVLAIEPFAFRIERAEGPFLIDVDGHRVLDLLGDYSAGLHARSATAAAAVRQVLARGWSYGAMSEPEIVFAEAVVARFPSVEQVRFTNSGSEANLFAVQTARHVTGRDRLVVFDGGYHGGPLYFGPGGEALRVPFDTIVLPYNDVDAARAAFARDGATVAAVLVEPMMGAGGCLPGDPAFLAELRALTSAAGALLIFDEVMTSRLAVGGAQERLGLVPDLTTLGKYLAGGLSFGAFGGRADVMAAFDPARGGALAHGGTFNNNAFTMAVGAALAAETDAALLAELNARGDRLRDRLNERFADSPVPFCATGTGSFVALHPVPGPVTTTAELAVADPRWRQLCFHELLDAGYYLAPRGYLALSVEVDDEHLEGFTAAVDRFLRLAASRA